MQLVNKPSYKPIRALFLYWIIYFWCSKWFFVLIWSCILKKLRSLMGLGELGGLLLLPWFNYLLEYRCYYIWMYVKSLRQFVWQHTDTQSSGCETMWWMAWAVDTVGGWISHHQPYNYASLPQITATSLNNSRHISICRIDLRQEVLKKKKERKKNGCEVSAPRVHLVLSPITVRQTVC